MSYESVGKLVDKWVNDPAFRGELRKDPTAAVQKMGATLSPEGGSIWCWSIPVVAR